MKDKKDLSDNLLKLTKLPLLAFGAPAYDIAMHNHNRLSSQRIVDPLH